MFCYETKCDRLHISLHISWCFIALCSKQKQCCKIYDCFVSFIWNSLYHVNSVLLLVMVRYVVKQNVTSDIFPDRIWQTELCFRISWPWWHHFTKNVTMHEGISDHSYVSLCYFTKQNCTDFNACSVTLCTQCDKQKECCRMFINCFVSLHVT